MAKGRSSKAKVADSSKEGTKKVSIAETEPIFDGESKWNIIRVTAHDDVTTLCKNDDCEEVAVATWANETKPDDEVPLCETCQEKEHGGWPEGFDRSTAVTTIKSEVLVESTEDATETSTNVKEEEEDATMSIENNVPMAQSTDVMMEDADSEQENDTTTATSKNKDEVMEEDGDDTQDKDNVMDEKDDTSDPSNDDDEEEEEDDGEEEQWELKEILSPEDIAKCVKCYTNVCRLLACCVYISSTDEEWYSCIDCQDKDFGGWPALEELPVTHLEKDHLQLLVEKCSKKKRPAMPAFDTSLSPVRDTTQGDETNTITPMHSAQASKGSKVTPTPAKQDVKKQAKMNATMIKKHQEWQDAATKAGGGRIVFKKNEAKPVIFEELYDAMKPMNITQIHAGLKAIVPPPVLKSCLDDMALDNKENQFCDSDDEDEAPKKKVKSEPLDESLAGSLSFKAGRNPNSSLYYVDHSKQKNNGNGLEPHARNELASDLAKVQEEESVLKFQHQGITNETEQLLSEPTNEEADALLEQLEPVVSHLRSRLEELEAMKCNEKRKIHLKALIANYAAQWRKRKGLCIDFLRAAEESTEGTISVKKCCSGDGQIDVESDESVIKNAIAYGKKKRSMASRTTVSRKKMKISKGLSAKTTGLASSSVTNGITADMKFVAVRISSSGMVERVHIGDDE